ncbi:MAG TPA: FtsX-like permease family protein [Gemmatimonadales bacterium]|jgi:lipoprotein-releasing system permease protein|nr:FtsX-like permease family protein [Gemmatimonadales bacterium]
MAASAAGERADLRAIFRWPSRLEWRIAQRYLRSRRSSRVASLNTIISTGGVAVGVMALIVVLGVMNGLRDDLRERILVANPHLRVLTFGAGLRLDDWRRVLLQVRKQPGVVAAAPEVISQAGITAGQDYGEGVNLVGFDPDTGTRSVTSLPQSIVKGDLSFRATKPGTDGGILLGSRLAARLSVYPGDVVTLVPVTQAKVNPAIGMAVPRFWKFEVSGLFQTGMFQYDNQFVVISREVAQRFTGLGDAVSGIAVRVVDPDRAPEIGAAIEKRLGYPYRVLDWQTQNVSLFSALQLEKLAMGLIIFFIMVVAAFNIVGTLIMVVADKTREIGILRAMGLTSPAVARVFLLQGAVIGVIGTAIGLVVGLTVSYVVDKSGWVRINPAVYFIDHLPVHVEATDALIVVVASLAIALLATVYPSRSAAGLTPVDAIRHE